MVDQLEDFSFQLGHDEYCTEIKQIDIIQGADGVSPTELAQARAVLGAAQRRALQTGPQHAAKVSILQSTLPHALDSQDVLHQINKLCRELYAQRYISVNIKQNPKNLRDLAIICWTDAAFGNRPDLSSTGGFITGMVCKSMLDGHRGCVNPLAWRSGRLPRIARSSLSAEIQALAEGEQELLFLRTQWAELLGIPLSLRDRIMQLAKFLLLWLWMRRVSSTPCRRATPRALHLV